MLPGGGDMIVRMAEADLSLDAYDVRALPSDSQARVVRNGHMRGAHEVAIVGLLLGYCGGSKCSPA